MWRHALGSEVPAYTGADGNGNGAIDQPDYQVWRSNFGLTLPAPTPPMAAAASVEPVAGPATAQIRIATGALALVSEPAPTTWKETAGATLATDAGFVKFALVRRPPRAAIAIPRGFSAVPTQTSGNVDLLLALDSVFSDNENMPLGADVLDAALADEDDEIDVTSSLVVTLASLKGSSAGGISWASE